MHDQPWRLLALPPMDPALLQALFAGEGVELLTPAERTDEAVAALLPTADLVLGDWTGALQLSAPGPRVCFVQQPSVGYDGIDTDAFAAAGVPVANCAGSNTVSVAEWCLSATLALFRQTVPADAAVRGGEWPQTAVGGRELAGSSVGVVGMGPIGRRVAASFHGLGCEVTYWSRNRHDDAPVPYAELDDLLATSDVVVLVIALGPQTTGLLDASRLKPGAFLVNGARGAVVDEPSVVEALRSGHLAGAALDVFATEPLPMDSPLRGLPSVLLSPHMAGSTSQAAMRIVAQSKDNLANAVAGRAVRDVVNGADPLVRRRG